jgi:acetylornithine aminotransferase
MQHVYNSTGHALKLPDIVDAEGVYLFDAGGRRYMDLESGVWCVSVGHKNARINRGIARQIDALMHAGFCYSNPVLEASARAVLDIVGFDGGRCAFLCSGSEAIEVARQIARHLSGSRLSMTLHDSYLGAYSSVTDRSSGWFVFDWEPCKHCPESERCNPACDALKRVPGRVSDFIFEPGSSSGFVRFPPRGLIRNLADSVRAGGGKLIANEVTTGVGRTGKWFGYQHYDLTPDLIAIGKGIGNGYPVSVAAIDAATMAQLREKPFKYAQSHQNDPLGAAVVREVIAEIEDRGLIPEARRKGDRFLTQLASLVDGRVVLAVRGRGLMMAVDLVDAATAEEIHSRLIARGFIVGNRGTTFRIDPPLTVTEAQFDEFVTALRTASHIDSCPRI